MHYPHFNWTLSDEDYDDDKDDCDNSDDDDDDEPGVMGHDHHDDDHDDPGALPPVLDGHGDKRDLSLRLHRPEQVSRLLVLIHLNSFDRFRTKSVYPEVIGTFTQVFTRFLPSFTSVLRTCW